MTALSTLDVFDEGKNLREAYGKYIIKNFVSVCLNPSILQRLEAGVFSLANDLIKGTCTSGWIRLMLACSPDEEVAQVLLEMGDCFDNARRSPGGMAVRSGKKKANFDLEVVRRCDEANNMSYRIFYYYAGRIKNVDVSGIDVVYKLCVARMRSDDAFQSSLSVWALLSLLDVSSSSSLSLVHCIDENVEGIFEAIGHYIALLEQKAASLSDVISRLESIHHSFDRAIDSFNKELYRVSKKGMKIVPN